MVKPAAPLVRTADAPPCRPPGIHDRRNPCLAACDRPTFVERCRKNQKSGRNGMAHSIGRRHVLAGSIASLAAPSVVRAQPKPIRIGVLTDMAGPYAANTG